VGEGGGVGVGAGVDGRVEERLKMLGVSILHWSQWSQQAVQPRPRRLGLGLAPF
jgi:hypothetical protein